MGQNVLGELVSLDRLLLPLLRVLVSSIGRLTEWAWVQWRFLWELAAGFLCGY